MTDPNLQRVGVTLSGKWTLTALLGVGGTAAVYSATHRNGKRVAVKILHPELCANTELVARFMREGYIANQIEHPGVVSVLDDDRTQDGLVYLVMELLEGESLSELLERRQTLPLGEAVAIADAVLDVIAAAHEKSVVHRDIKPENVFVLAAGGIRVLDFGIAKARHLQAGANATQVGSLLGTPGFMPPEQARGRVELIDSRTDVWALGATLLCMLTGRRLHEAATTNESLLLAMTEAVAPARVLMPSLPEPIARLIDCALAFDREARWADARAMQAALRAAYCEPLLAPQDRFPAAERERSGPTVALLSCTLNAANGAVSTAPAQPSRHGSRLRMRQVIPWAVFGLLALGLGALVLLLASRPAHESQALVAGGWHVAPTLEALEGSKPIDGSGSEVSAPEVVAAQSPSPGSRGVVGCSSGEASCAAAVRSVAIPPSASIAPKPPASSPSRAGPHPDPLRARK